MFKGILTKILFLFLLIISFFGAVAQSPASYNQYMDNLTPINPASTLMEEEGKVNILARQQWLNIKGAPILMLFNGDWPLKIDGAKAGIVASSNQLGTESAVEFNGFFAKSIDLNETQKLGISINIGFRYYTTDYASLDPRDPIIQNDIKAFKPNTGFGVIFYSNNYYIGISMPELTIRNLGNASLTDNNNFRNHYYLTGGITANLNEDLKLKPAALVYYSRGVPVTADISTKLYIRDAIGFGINYRTNNEIAALFSFNTEFFRVGYSYQFGTSAANIGGLSNATHEIMLTFPFYQGNKVPINPANR